MNVMTFMPLHLHVLSVPLNEMSKINEKQSYNVQVA